MMFQSGDKVKYIGDGSSDLRRGQIYTVSKRSEFGPGVHLHEFSGKYDWWYDHRFELAEPKLYVVLTKHTHEFGEGSFNPRIEHFIKAEKFTKEELQAWIADNHDYACEIFKCVPVKVTMRTIVEVEG